MICERINTVAWTITKTTNYYCPSETSQQNKFLHLDHYIEITVDFFLNKQGRKGFWFTSASCKATRDTSSALLRFET